MTPTSPRPIGPAMAAKLLAALGLEVRLVAKGEA